MVNSQRVRTLSSSFYTKGTVVYQMCRDIRAHDNDALLFAQELAKEHGAQLIVNYVIWNYEWEGATRRFYDWVLPSLEEVEKELRTHNIPLVITFQNERFFTKKKFEPIPSHIGAVVIDELPLRFMKKWKEQFLKHHAETPLYEVDAHNCIPVWELSDKQEFAAHTIRRKVHAKLSEFLEEFGKLKYHDENNELIKTIPAIDWREVATKITCNETVSGTGSFVPGEQHAHKMLTHFLEAKLSAYDVTRNEINTDGQSNLSPYISHGNISRRRIILELLKKTGGKIEELFDEVKNGSNGEMGSVAAFIEETVVRAEISENFCFYNSQYDSYEGFPAWAKETLAKASTDTREYVYSYKQFEKGETHDQLWNAAQMQMVTTGKMHGYMRMYWAKKILEWSSSPKEAIRTAVKLNDTYELDGRDPGGYVGCAWSIGGVHDRPWFGRPIFGAVRYMAESGVKKRGKVGLYIEKYLSNKAKFF
jgi:deoxyribodipyrimidine photo-lyase